MEGESSSSSTYEVLYFKGKNKVHKSKGVSKMDGCLVLDSKTCMVKLYEESGSRPIHSSTNTEIAKRAFSVEEEVNLAQYQVEIVSVMSTTTTTAKKGNPTSKPVARMSDSNQTAKLIRKPLSLANRKPTTITNRPKSLFKKSDTTILLSTAGRIADHQRSQREVRQQTM
jgi:hypothetical protein